MAGAPVKLRPPPSSAHLTERAREAPSALLVTTLFVLTGCGSLVLRPADAFPLKALKVTTRVPLALMTLYISEIQIKCDGGAYTPDECARAWRLYVAMLGGSGQPRETLQGCCSWHHGVFGCDYQANRIVCIDGQFSPTCQCPLRSGLVDFSASLNTTCCVLGDATGCDYRVGRVVCSDGSYGNCACGP